MCRTLSMHPVLSYRAKVILCTHLTLMSRWSVQAVTHHECSLQTSLDIQITIIPPSSHWHENDHWPNPWHTHHEVNSQNFVDKIISSTSYWRQDGQHPWHRLGYTLWKQPGSFCGYNNAIYLTFTSWWSLIHSAVTWIRLHITKAAWKLLRIQ